DRDRRARPGGERAAGASRSEAGAGEAGLRVGAAVRRTGGDRSDSGTGTDAGAGTGTGAAIEFGIEHVFTRAGIVGRNSGPAEQRGIRHRERSSSRTRSRTGARSSGSGA